MSLSSSNNLLDILRGLAKNQQGLTIDHRPCSVCCVSDFRPSIILDFLAMFPSAISHVDVDKVVMEV